MIGQKGWLFCDTPAGAKSSAIVYSMVEMAKANGLNIYRYLNYVLKHQASSLMVDNQLDAFSPWTESVIESCGADVK